MDKGGYTLHTLQGVLEDSNKSSLMGQFQDDGEEDDGRYWSLCYSHIPGKGR